MLLIKNKKFRNKDFSKTFDEFANKISRKKSNAISIRFLYVFRVFIIS